MTSQAPNGQQMKFTKTETEYNMRSIRFLLLTITTMFIIISALMIVLGMSVYMHYHSFSFFYDNGVNGQIFTPSVLCILVGMALLIITMFGFLGSLKQSTCMVNTYAVILTVILIIKMVVVILAFTIVREEIVDYINIPVSYYTKDLEIRDEIDRMQVSLNCCGSKSYFDYAHLEFDGNHTTVTVINTEWMTGPGDVRRTEVPETCCISASDSICTLVRGTGCRDALANLVVQNASVLGVLGVSVMFIQLLGIIFALLLARCIRKVKSEKALMAWKIKEQVILARLNEESQITDGQKKEQTVYIAHPDSSVV